MDNGGGATTLSDFITRTFLLLELPKIGTVRSGFSSTSSKSSDPGVLVLLGKLRDDIPPTANEASEIA